MRSKFKRYIMLAVVTGLFLGFLFNNNALALPSTCDASASDPASAGQSYKAGFCYLGWFTNGYGNEGGGCFGGFVLPPADGSDPYGNNAGLESIFPGPTYPISGTNLATYQGGADLTALTNLIVNDYNSSGSNCSTQLSTGANFIISSMTYNDTNPWGDKGDPVAWRTSEELALSDPNSGIQAQFVNNYAYNVNTYYQGDSNNDDAMYQNTSSANAVVFYANCAPEGSGCQAFFAIRIQCGNPVFATVPVPPPALIQDNSPSLTAQCNADGTITGKSRDPDGNPVTIRIKTVGRSPTNVVGIAGSSGNTGYWEADSTGAVYEFGTAPDLGGVGPPGSARIVGIVGTSDGGGYWLVDDTGQVYAKGDAVNYGNSPSGERTDVVGMASTPDGKGYWLVTRYGSVVAFGDAGVYQTVYPTGYGGSKEPNIVGIADDVSVPESTTGPGGTTLLSAYYGYILMGSDGHVFAGTGSPQVVSQGKYQGSYNTTPQGLTAVGISSDPVVEPNPSNAYYYEYTTGGHIWKLPGFTSLYGSPAGNSETIANPPITGMATTSDGGGYWLVDSGGEVYNFGNAKDHGWALSETLGTTLTQPSGPGTPPYSSNPNFSYDVSNYIDTDPNGTTFEVVAEDVTPPGFVGTPAANATAFVVCNAISPVAGNVTCNFNKTDPTEYSFESFPVVMTVKYTGSGSISGTVDIKINGQDYVFSATGASSPFNVPEKSVKINAAGTFELTGSFTDSGGTTANCASQVETLYDQPYLSVTGGDVSVGGNFGTSCTQNKPSNSDLWPGVYSWNNDATGYTGAGTQFATYTLGRIDGFASSMGNSPPLNLAFSNTVPSYINVPHSPTNNATDGGDFESVACPTDYFTSAPTTVTTLSGNTNIPTTSLVSPGNDTIENYKVPSGDTLTLSGNASIPDNTQLTIYVTGNVYLDGNVTYAHNSGWATINNIPAFRLYVTGNIYIDNSVTNLEGVYVAEPHPITGTSYGVIYDCSTNVPGPVSTVNLSSQCDTSLNVNGSFTAYHIDFERVNGTLGSLVPAESFTYDPAVWLAAPSATSQGQYNAIENLPPVL